MTETYPSQPCVVGCGFCRDSVCEDVTTFLKNTDYFGNRKDGRNGIVGSSPERCYTAGLAGRWNWRRKMKQHSGSQDEVVFSVTQATVESLLRPKISPLHAAEVHLWEFPLAVDDSVFSALEQHLSGEERTRAARFHAPADRRRFAVGRGVVRSILAAYTA